MAASTTAPWLQSDAFLGASELNFRFSLEQPFLRSYVILDELGALRARFRRSGAGLSVFLMNYELVDAGNHPLAYVRQPRPKHLVGYNLPFTLTDANGTELGELRYHPFAFRSIRSSLIRPGSGSLAAKGSYPFHDFSIRRSSVELATLHLDWIPRPGGVHLRFGPIATMPIDRLLMVGLTAFMLIRIDVLQVPILR